MSVARLNLARHDHKSPMSQIKNPCSLQTALTQVGTNLAYRAHPFWIEGRVNLKVALILNKASPLATDRTLSMDPPYEIIGQKSAASRRPMVRGRMMFSAGGMAMGVISPG